MKCTSVYPKYYVLYDLSEIIPPLLFIWDRNVISKTYAREEAKSNKYLSPEVVYENFDNLILQRLIEKNQFSLVKNIQPYS